MILSPPVVKEVSVGSRVWPGVCSGLLLAALLLADGSGMAMAEDAGPARGTVTGKVVYKTDSARPWRLGRYYLKRTGELAEAVVALSGPLLVQADKEATADQEAKTWVVDQKDFQFTPETTAVQAGDRVKFLNSDKQLHNVQAFHLRQSFNVNMPPGGEHIETLRFAEGIKRPYRLGCVYHSAMQAWIFVFDHPYFAVTAKEGTFTLTNVPPGEYQLDVSHPAGDLRSTQTITVASGAKVEVEVELSPDDLKK
ncbi:carboxypeptidase regulatory-like domain-containing protein [Lignipirellula cremea]|uniref:Rhamnogalacturonan lyase domain-containing protein n=1 Tax=Lignipirellula cremea TaxID=2528010 RepID=A0A518DMC7_9BACT|nr:carboxypeptidase regulatory-like domain-containing protein [Lignipirellula cremea]QDU92995.1 hypothetical protein Pla8534_07700 [Lignipirellula cremea]